MRFKWSLIDSETGRRDRAPRAGFRHRHELFMTQLLESVEALTGGRRIDVERMQRCVAGESQRFVIASRWLQFTSEWQRL